MIIGLSTSLGAVTLLIGVPSLSPAVHPVLGVAVGSSLVLFYLLFIWSWFYTGLSDPGRVKDDLRARGVRFDIFGAKITRALKSDILAGKILPAVT
jgi:hypothetical protein